MQCSRRGADSLSAVLPLPIPRISFAKMYTLSLALSLGALAAARPEYGKKIEAEVAGKGQRLARWEAADLVGIKVSSYIAIMRLLTVSRSSMADKMPRHRHTRTTRSVMTKMAIFMVGGTDG